MTQQLQFLIHAAVIDGGFDYCWHLDIFGCRSADGMLPTATHAEKRYCMLSSQPYNSCCSPSNGADISSTHSKSYATEAVRVIICINTVLYTASGSRTQDMYTSRLQYYAYTCHSNLWYSGTCGFTGNCNPLLCSMLQNQKVRCL